MPTTDLHDLARLHGLVRSAQVMERHGTSVERGLRVKAKWERRAAPAFQSALGPVPSVEVVDELIDAAEKDWKRLSKAGIRDFVKQFAKLGAKLQAIFEPQEEGGLGVYLSLAQDISEDSGQATLDNLGLNKTFRWTNPREMARDQFAVRGSKIIQDAYGNHVADLQKMVVKATDPAHPRSRKDVRAEILERWPLIGRYNAERIARSETAAVWETTNINTMMANGVKEVDWVIAHGPSIGPPKSEDVCPTCLLRSTRGPYPIGEAPIPPAHPNCRCTLVSALAKDWLPPAETWTGGSAEQLPTFRVTEVPA